jgi:hypothetical protein
MATNKIIKVDRTVNFYELNFDFLGTNSFSDFFEIITKLAKSRAKIRYQRFGDKFVFIQGIQNENQFLVAKMRCVRKDLLPELMNTNTDETKGIEAKEEEGVVETTHFIIDYRKQKTILALEYNHQGSKITDLVHYIQRIGVHKNLLKKVGFNLIVKDDLQKLTEKLNRFSEFTVKVHKDNVPKIKKMDKRIWGALKAAQDNFDSDFATLILKYNYKQRSETPFITESFVNLVKHLGKNNKDKYLFNTLSLKAEDAERNNLLGNFDLLLEKVHSKIKVERKPKYKTLISEDMFEKMMSELYNGNFS